MKHPHATPTLFPYTTLFRSEAVSPFECHVRLAVFPPALASSGCRQGNRSSQKEVRMNRTWWQALGIGALVALLVTRSEEHTSELQSHSDLVCRLLLETKNRG